MRKFDEGIVEDKESPDTIKYLVKSILTSANRNAWENITYEAPAVNTEIQILGTSVHRAPTRKEQIILSNDNYTPTNIITFKQTIEKKLKYNCNNNNDNPKCCDKYAFVTDIGFIKIVNFIQLRNNNDTVNGLFVKYYRYIDSDIETEQMKKIQLTLNEQFVSITRVDGLIIMIFCSNSTYGIEMANGSETD